MRRTISPPAAGESETAFMRRCQDGGADEATCELLWQDSQGISPSKGIPLRPDPLAMRQADRRSFIRALAAMTLATRDNARPETVLARAFPGDIGAGRILRAATSPSTTSGFPAATAQKILPQLAPQSASSRLLDLASSVDLSGLTSIKVPFVGQSGRPPVPFVGEGLPMPIVDLTTSMLTVGPARKMLIGSTLTREIQVASGGNAEAIISGAISASAEQSLDNLLFSNAAATAAAPAGLLAGLVAIPSAGKTGVEGAADDLALLAAAIAASGINSDGMIIITSAALATKLRCLVSLKFSNEILSSSSIAGGEVIAVVPQGLVTAYDGNVTVEITNEPVVHFEDTAPTDISAVGSPATIAAPVRSLWQTDSIVIKIRGWAAWAVHPGAIQVLTGAAW
jgi:hypothetical protein